MINTSGLGTFFLCTSSSTDPQSVAVEVFKGDGTASGSGTLVVGPGKSVMFGTRSALGVDVDSNMGSAAISVGSARILSTVKGKLLCSAFVADGNNSPPVSMTYLTIVAKTKQKAAN